ncbi:hypothetical protein LEP1GSC050_0056 [Leptospira phage vB_LbrZ_5399-LE1]|nr:hypothetical protein LEP1GSC050_0056 [Leptospira phage vB_LbrZ_5399-LE1]AGS80814.1 hypothetical protein LEP1GSC047_0913 [Leptospira phage vB_LinZ_10-LE1]
MVLYPTVMHVPTAPEQLHCEVLIVPPAPAEQLEELKGVL